MLPDLKGALVGLVIIGVAIGVAIACAVPWVWRLVKPLLHAITA